MVLALYVAWVVYALLAAAGPSDFIPESFTEVKRFLALVVAAVLAVAIDRITHGRLHPRD